jgi:hypothetical protein
VQFIPTDYYTLHNNDGYSFTLEYNKSVLSGSAVADDPIREIVVPDNGGETQLQASATYDGCATPFTYTLNAKYLVVHNKDSLDFEKWKQKCQRYLTLSSSSSVVWIAKSGDWEYRDYIPLPNNATQQISDKDENKFDRTLQTQKEGQNPNTSIITSFKQKKDEKTGNINYEFATTGAYQDSVLYVCFIFEETEERKFSYFVPLKADDKVPNHFCGSYRNNELKIADYAVCTENPSLSDSLISSDNVIYNKARHTIAALVLFKDNKWDNVLIPPHKYYRCQTENIQTIRYFNVPNSVLTEEYMPLRLFPELHKIICWAIGGFCIGLYIYIMLPIIEILSENGLKWRDKKWIFLSFLRKRTWHIPDILLCAFVSMPILVVLMTACHMYDYFH